MDMMAGQLKKLLIMVIICVFSTCCPGYWPVAVEATVNTSNGWKLEKQSSQRHAGRGEKIRFTVTLTRTGPAVQGAYLIDVRSTQTTRFIDPVPAPTFGGGTAAYISWKNLNLNTGDSFTASYSVEVGDMTDAETISNYVMAGGPDSPISIDNTIQTKPFNITRGGSKSAKVEPPDPINAATGEYFIEPITDISLVGPMPLEFRRWYASDLTGDLNFTGTLGKNWMHNFEYYIQDPATAPKVVYDQGRMVYFSAVWSDDETKYDLNYHQEPVPYKLERDSAGHFWFMDPESEQVYHFDDQGLLMNVFDRNGNRQAIVRDAQGRVVQVSDGLGRTLAFQYNAAGLLIQVSDGFAPVAFSYDSQNRLIASTDQMGHATRYELDALPMLAPMITAVVRPRGNIPYTQEYDGNLRVGRQVDAYGAATTLAYDSPDQDQTQVSDAMGVQTFTHEEKNKCTESTDRSGASAALDYNDRDLLEKLTDRQGDAISYTFDDESRLPLSTTNAQGDVITYDYLAQDNVFGNPVDPQASVSFTFHDLVKTTYPDGKTEAMTYDQAGNYTTIVDRDQAVWTYAYNQAGQPLKAVNPLGGETTYEYNPDGTLKSVSSPGRGVTGFEYDAGKRNIRINYPNGAHSRISYDNMGRIIGLVDQNGRSYGYVFDENGNLVREVDPLGRPTIYQYDLMDRLASITNRLGGVTSFTYDALGRTASVTDPAGNIRTFVNDDAERKVTITDEAGYAWQRRYDEEGLLASITTPLGRVTSLTRNKLGQIECVANPLGARTCFTYDKMSLINRVVDPLGQSTDFSHNGNDFIDAIGAPMSRNAAYRRGAMGMIRELTDPSGAVWKFTQTNMGVEATHTDPLGNSHVYVSDDSGLRSASYPTGETLVNTYDAAGNLTRAEWSDGSAVEMFYDDAYQITRINDLGFTHNDDGMVTGTSGEGFDFTATYNQDGKVASAGYAGLFDVDYQYDARGNISSITDSLTNSRVWFNYDLDGRLIRIGRSSGLSTDFSWDDGSRLTEVVDGAVSEQKYSYDADSKMTRAELNVPLDSAAATSSRTDRFDFDAASQIATEGYEYDARGRLLESPNCSFRWDAAGRLIAAGEATFTYNGLYGVSSRTTAGEKTTFHYNFAFGILPVMAERNVNTGKWKRFYVWSPGGGMLLYAIEPENENRVTFYHYNTMGDVLFLTDKAGQVVDSYAYSPYGIMLDHEGRSDQPFTFQGQFGVRWEPSAQCYQMGMRYYDPVAARFLSRDPLWMTEDDIFSLNPYQYANQNPLKYIDPTGLGVGYNFGFYGGMNTYRRDGNENVCPLPCTGQCKKIEVSKVMLVLGTDSGWMGAGSMLRKSYRWAKKYLEEKCGKNNVITLRKPTWETLRDTLAANRDDLAGFVFLGHGSSFGGVDVMNNAANASFFSRALGSQSHIPNVFMFACHQGAAANAERWANVFHYDNFYGPDRLLGAYGLYFSYINYVKKVTCQKTWKWICVEQTQTPQPVKTVTERTKTHIGKKETTTTTIKSQPK
ncbi:MAG: RHS repeat-associated core domain-containing protein [Pseudomonadota bacterium]